MARARATDAAKLRVSVRPERDRALVFAHRQLHEGAPVTTGRKYVLRTDVMYVPRFDRTC